MATKTKKPLKERFGEFKVKVKDYKAALKEAVNAWLRVTDSPRGCGNINAWTSIMPAQRVRRREKRSAHKVAAAHGSILLLYVLLPWAITDNAVVKLRRRLSSL